MYKCLHSPATVKLSVSLSEAALTHITVVSFLMIVLEAVTRRVEVKLEFRGVFTPLTLRREMVNVPRLKGIGGVSPAVYKVCWVKSGLRHSSTRDPITRQVNVTCSPGHVNCLVLVELSSTMPTDRKMASGDTYRYYIAVSVQITFDNKESLCIMGVVQTAHKLLAASYLV